MFKGLKLAAILGGVVLGSVCISHAKIAEAKAPKYKETEVTNGGTIVGTVKFEGKVPKVKMLKVNKDQKTCGHGKKESDMLVINEDSMGISNVVVSLADIAEGKKISQEKAVMDQKECVFIPHVIAISAGTEVDFLNSDNVMHNLHSWSIRNPAFNEGVSGGGTLTKKFDIPELVKITCDVHKWMSAFVVVKGNPYFAVTDADGNFVIENVPAGTYKIDAWQERLGKEKAEVTVSAGEKTTVDFVYKK